MNKRFVLSFLALVLCALCSIAAAQDAYEHPYWRITKFSTPPAVDGVIHPDEYAHCAAITGMVTWGGPGSPDKTLVPKVQDVTWYLGYDDNYLYIAMRSPQPPGTWPKARCKSNDSSDILWDDHVEIQFATKGRRSVASPGKGFYKIIANPRGFYRDEWLFNGTPGTEQAWSIGGDVKCTTTADHWDMEIKVARDAFREKSFEGDDWTVQLLRADAPGGVYFAGWVGEGWMEWSKFGEVVFDAGAPAFRFLDSGDILNGQVSPKFEVVGGSKAQQVDTTIEVTDGTGKSLFKDTKSAAVQPGESKQISFDAGRVPITDHGNVMHILATMLQPGGDPQKLYEVKIPVVKLTEKYQKEIVDPWLAARPRSGEFDWKFFYWPSYGVAENNLDVDFFGMKDEIFNAKSFDVRVFSADGKKMLASGKSEMKDHAGRLVFNTGNLPAGSYVAKLRLYGKDGKTVVAEQKRDFVRKHYEWENNNLGRDDVVLPPYPPLQVKDKVLMPWMRDITIGDNGLPAQIVCEGGPAKESILRGPIMLSYQEPDTDLHWRSTGVTMGRSTPTHVDWTSANTSDFGNIDLTGRMEYDGWIDVNITLQPSDKAHEMSLVIPLWKGADTMYVQRGGDGFSGANHIGEIPAGEGVVWDSSKLLPCNWGKDWKSFAPIAYAGNGDKGIWWFAVDNRDWTMSDSLPAIQYVRTKDGVDLKINIIAAPTKLDKPRQIHFALLVDPVKKMEDERKIGWGYEGKYFGGRYAHNTFGWRGWGRSDDGYYMEDADREKLRKVLLDESPTEGNSGTYFQRNLDSAAKNGDKVVLYGSTSNMSWDLPEFDTYQGEWIRYTTVPPMDKLAAKPGDWNHEHSVQFLTDRQQGEQGINWTKSQQDCFVWYHKKLLETCPVNGTWWDNGSNFTITDYDPERKEFYDRWNVFERRDLCKRLNTIGYEVGRAPWWINNMHVDWSFNQVSWHIENDFYVNDPTNTMLDEMTVANFRALTRIKRGIIHRLASRYGGGSGPSTAEEIRRRSRNTIGLCLLHDIGAYRWDNYDRYYDYFPSLLDKYVGFFSENDACKFTGYWYSGDMVKVSTPKVYASVYQGNGRAVIVFLSESKSPVDVEFEVTDKLLGRKPVKIMDAETTIPFTQLYDSQLKTSRWGEFEPGKFQLEGFGVRMVVVE